ncbi:LysR family transcriptional regulator [Pelagibaculum spongiae]|uniref:LysR family transcriptional regulator n=1 Tax=Pelagibaculum spongiae TaxID=2080658 RepID=A0A2V1GV67_9GAMM|nr:LysR family transcriptional regulator [Pelagibaculum spongiae]PVZ63514.1 LysR family transcriptional regulator [Pelagibaculum spongiae]
MNSRNITLKHLRVFTAVAKHSSLTRAAEMLHITKSAASMALQDLERQLDQQLFERLKNRLVLNSNGDRLRPLADELLQRLETIESTMQSKQLNGVLHIGASKTIGNHILPAILGDFLPQYQCDRPELVIHNTTVLEKMLQAFELDMALIEGQVQSPMLISTPWHTDRMLVIAPLGHPLANQQPQPANILDDQNWVMREANSGTRQQFYHLLEPALSCWHLALEINTNEAVINAVSSGLGLGFISNLAAKDALKAGRISTINLTCATERQFYLVTHRDKYQGPFMKCFNEFCINWVNDC